MSSRLRATLPLLGFALPLFLLARPPGPQPESNDRAPLLPRKELLQVLGAGHIQLLADYYWVQTLQATTRAKDAAGFRAIFDYADLLSDLDPKFREIYVFAGAVLPVNLGNGRWANTHESTLILEKGYAVLPDHVLLRILLAFNLANYENQPQRAAQILAETAKLPGAPAYLPALATRMYSEARDFDAGLALARSLYESAEDEETRATFELRYKDLLLERELVRVEEAIKRYQGREGRPPADVAALLSSGDLAQPPSDPFGGSIELTEDGSARSTARDERLRLYRAEEQ